MTSIAKICTETVYENLKPLHANWEPGRPVQLGDFGVMRDRTFIYLGNIRDQKIEFSARTDPASDHKFFASEGTTDVKFQAKGSAPVEAVANVKATLEVNFSSNEAVFFNAAGCDYTMIADKVALAKETMTRFANNEWERDWAVVTDLVKASSTTLAVSAGNTASIVFESKADIERINLADASLGLTVKTAKNIGYQVVAENGLIPLFGLCKIQSTFLWWGDKFNPLSHGFGDERIVQVLEASPRVKTEESGDALFFGQLR